MKLSVGMDNGWVVVEAVLLIRSPLMLVTFQDQTGHKRYVRYDSAKQAFIDAAPVKLTPTLMQMLESIENE